MITIEKYDQSNTIYDKQNKKPRRRGTKGKKTNPPQEKA